MVGHKKPVYTCFSKHPTRNLENHSYLPGKFSGVGRRKNFRTHRVLPVLKSTKREIPFLQPKCPIQHEILKISLIFLENLWEMRWMKNFHTHRDPLCSGSQYTWRGKFSF